MLDTVYTVKYTKRVPRKGNGLILFDRTMIYVFDDGKVDVGHVLNTLIHELVHAVCYHMHISEVENSPHEEDIVTKLANGLTGVLRDADIDWVKIKA